MFPGCYIAGLEVVRGTNAIVDWPMELACELKLDTNSSTVSGYSCTG
jgi:hypothetical protein